VTLASSSFISMAAHQPSCRTETPKPALKGLAAAFKQALSLHSSKECDATANHSNKQGSEMRHWLCGCTDARSNSSIHSAAADAYLEAPLIFRDSSDRAQQQDSKQGVHVATIHYSHVKQQALWQ
jgi:hypothetical protein